MIRLTKINGLEEAKAKLKEMGAPPTRPMGQTIGHLVQTLKNAYPPQSGRAQPFRSDRSRRWFFANLRAGTISVPYKRTYALKEGWTGRATGGGWGALIENRAPHAQMVMGRNQVGYHRGNWPQAEQIVRREEAPTCVGFFEAEYKRRAG